MSFHLHSASRRVGAVGWPCTHATRECTTHPHIGTSTPPLPPHEGIYRYVPATPPENPCTTFVWKGSLTECGRISGASVVPALDRFPQSSCSAVVPVVPSQKSCVGRTGFSRVRVEGDTLSEPTSGIPPTRLSPSSNPLWVPRKPRHLRRALGWWYNWPVDVRPPLSSP